MATKSGLGARSRDMEPFRAFRNQIDSYFEDWFGRNMSGVLAPRIDVTESNNEVLLSTELPGVEQKDIDISLVGDRLTIKGEKRSEHEDKKNEQGRVVHRIERSYGAFERTVTLPYTAEPGLISAEFQDGVLRIRVRKPHDAKQHAEAHKIEVRGPGGGSAPAKEVPPGM